MMLCRYYNKLTGLKGECRGEPTKSVNSQWEYPIVEHGCHCRFYDDGKPEQPEQTARQKALAKKKEQQEKLKKSQS